MGATEKVSLTMDRHSLHLAKTAAERTGMSLSSLVNAALGRHLAEVLAELQRRRAAEEVIASFPAKLLPSASEQAQLHALWSCGGAAPSEAEVKAAFRRPSRTPKTRRRAARS